MPHTKLFLGRRSVADLALALDRLAPEVRLSIQEAAETWQRGGALAVLEVESGRAAALAKVYGDQILEDPAAAGENLKRAYGRFVRQLQEFARLQMDIEAHRSRGALPAVAPEWMAMPAGATGEPPRPDAPDDGDAEPDAPDVGDLARALARLPYRERLALARALLASAGGVGPSTGQDGSRSGG